MQPPSDTFYLTIAIIIFSFILTFAIAIWIDQKNSNRQLKMKK